ncbi:MAG: AAA family ATPase, partial [Clostridia bacterium]|nr:AAA family ATPase [Clostridia bacterium]
MKFIECYIENFGKLKEFRQEFKDGLNVILEDNGFGKTTFAAFIQAMFYGLDAGRAKDSDRKKYDPWQGGKFGGSIIFSLNGKTYRLERFFGKKEKDDTFTLYNEETGLESKDFSENIGCEIFGIDKESYGKSAYIPQGKVEAELAGAGDINAKLSDLSEADNDMASFDKAMQTLKDLKNKYKRSTGLIQEKELAKSNAESSLKHSENLLETEKMIKEELHTKRRLKKELEGKIEKLHKSNAEKEKAEHYKTIKKDAEDSESRIKGYEAEMKRIPDSEELSSLYTLTEEYKRSETIKRTAELSETEKEVLDKADAYGIHELSEEDYKSITEKIQAYKTKKAVTESANLTEEERMRLLNLRKMFSGNDFDMAKLEEIYYRAREGKEKLGFLKT